MKYFTKTRTLFIAVSSLVLSYCGLNTALAADSFGGHFNIDTSSTAIKNLQAQLLAIHSANMKLNAQENYQYDPYLLLNNKANGASVTDASNHQVLNLNNYVTTLAGNNTQTRLTTSLQQIANAMYPNRQLQAAIDKNPVLNNTLNYLTQGTQASDIPQIPGEEYSQSNNDSYFNMASLLQPMAYKTSDQQQAAENYIKYATHLDTNAVIKQLGLDKFQNLLSRTKTADAKKQLIDQLISSPNFQRLMLYLRSNLTSQSVALDVYNYLLAERIQVPGLGKEAGVKDKQGKTVNDASPMQIMGYLATKAHDAAWYRHVQSASPATVQREILTTLAQIERQNYQAYRQNEMMLAVMASMQMQMAKASSATGLTLVSQAKQDVDSVVSNNSDSN